MEQKIRQKSEKVFDVAEFLSDWVKCSKHGLVLVFVAGFCLYFLGSVSIMLRDLQDASAMPQNIPLYVKAVAHS